MSEREREMERGDRKTEQESVNSAFFFSVNGLALQGAVCAFCSFTPLFQLPLMIYKEENLSLHQAFGSIILCLVYFSQATHLSNQPIVWQLCNAKKKEKIKKTFMQIQVKASVNVHIMCEKQKNIQ